MNTVTHVGFPPPHLEKSFKNNKNGARAVAKTLAVPQLPWAFPPLAFLAAGPPQKGGISLPFSRKRGGNQRILYCCANQGKLARGAPEKKGRRPSFHKIPFLPVFLRGLKRHSAQNSPPVLLMGPTKKRPAFFWGGGGRKQEIPNRNRRVRRSLPIS